MDLLVAGDHAILAAGGEDHGVVAGTHRLGLVGRAYELADGGGELVDVTGVSTSMSWLGALATALARRAGGPIAGWD